MILQVAKMFEQVMIQPLETIFRQVNNNTQTLNNHLYTSFFLRVIVQRQMYTEVEGNTAFAGKPPIGITISISEKFDKSTT